MPPRQVNPPLTPVAGNPATNPGAPVGSNWVPGGIPIPPFPHQGSKSGEGELAIGDPNGSGGVPAAPVRDILVDCSRRDLSSDKMPKQEDSTPEGTGPTRGILCPSKLPRRDLKYSEEQHTLLDFQGHLIGCMQLMDIAKSERGSASKSGTAKWKEPNTPDLGSEGASAPAQKWVRIKGATYRHGSAPSIHVGASLHDVPERDEGDAYEKDGEEGDEDYNKDIN